MESQIDLPTEQLGLGVVDDVLHIVGVELLQDRNNHGTIGDGGHENGDPRGRVLANQGNVVASLNAEVLI